MITRHVKACIRTLDIGAKAGFYTLALSRLVSERGTVRAFELLAKNVVNLLK